MSKTLTTKELEDLNKNSTKYEKTNTAFEGMVFVGDIQNKGLIIENFKPSTLGDYDSIEITAVDIAARERIQILTSSKVIKSQLEAYAGSNDLPITCKIIKIKNYYSLSEY